MSRFEFIAVYIMASQRNGTLYLGVTGDLLQRGHQHREGLIDGFSKRYGCKHLVWFEQHTEMVAAIAREKAIKKWTRAWKLDLIESSIRSGAISTRTSSIHRRQHFSPDAPSSLNY